MIAYCLVNWQNQIYSMGILIEELPLIYIESVKKEAN